MNELIDWLFSMGVFWLYILVGFAICTILEFIGKGISKRWKWWRDYM